MKFVEFQFSSESPVQVHQEDKKAKIMGLAVPYDRPSKTEEVYDEEVVSVQFEKGAFGDVENDKNIRLCFGHDRYDILGRNTVNMRLQDRQDGLYLEAELDPTENDLTRRALSYVRQGFVDGFSVGGIYAAPKQRFALDSGPCLLFDKARLKEISIVDNPCFREAGVAMAMSSDGNALSGSAGIAYLMDSLDKAGKEKDTGLDQRFLI